MKLNNIKYLLVLFFAFVYQSAQSQESIKIMTFNIRYDNPDDGEQNWKFRKDNAANMILFHDVDIIGMQEVLHSQLEDLIERLPQYKFVGVGRDDGKEKGEYGPIFYKKDKFSKIMDGVFWLSENSKIPGKGWDAVCNRIVTWIILKEKKSGKEIAFFNTHFDHRGKEARKQSAILLLSKIKEIAGDRPIMVAGDFNATPDSNVIQPIVDNTKPFYLRDSRNEAKIIYGPEWTVHSFGKTPLNKRRIIDYVFMKNNCSVIRYGVLSESINNVFLSDHCPVLTQITLD